VVAAFLLARSGEEKTAIREYIEKTFGYNPDEKVGEETFGRGWISRKFSHFQ
jgi:hypothetical protein